VPFLRHSSPDNGIRDREAGPTTGTPTLERALAIRSWTKDAACASDPWSELQWFPERGAAESGEDVASAKRLAPLLVCRSCPVRPDCLRDSLTVFTFTHRQADARTQEHRSEAPHELGITKGVWGATF
jgi:hypothetical protein